MTAIVKNNVNNVNSKHADEQKQLSEKEKSRSTQNKISQAQRAGEEQFGYLEPTEGSTEEGSTREGGGMKFNFFKY